MKLGLNVDLDKVRRVTASLLSSEQFREVGSVALIALLTSAMLFPALRGDWPIGHDHPVHLFRIWQLREAIVHHLTPWTWSHRWFAGYPQNVIYPVGADLFVLAVQALSLGTLSLGRAYGLAFWSFYFLYGYAAFFLVRRAIGSRIAGLITVLFLLTEPGSNDVGGWFWLVDLGVWTAGLGMVPALIGTVRIADLFEKPAPRTAAAIAACVGLALLCHPLFLIYFGLAIPLLCASRYLSDEETPWRHALLWLGVATVTGLCIASFWLVPYFSASAYAQQLGGVGSSISRLGAAVIGDTLFLGMHIPAMVLGLIGAIFLLRSRRTLPLFMGLFVFVCIAGASSTVVELFGPGVTLWIKKHINSIRLLMLAKPFWYGSAAFLLVAAWNGAKRILIPQGSLRSSEQTSRHKWSRRTAMIIFGLAFVLPVVFPAARAFFQNEIRRPTVWHSQREDIPARQAFLAWAQEFRTGDPRFFRIAHGFDPNDNLTDLGIDLPWPLYKIGGTPTGHFKYNVASLSSQAMRAFNVRFALSEHPLTNRPDFALLRTFKQRLWLYEFRDWNPVPFEIIGEGPVELEDFRDEDIVLRAETGAHGLLRLNVTYYPKWQATRDGVPVPITPVPIAWVEHSALMQVELKPGTYRFHYRKGASDYIGTILCLIGIAGSVALANWKRLSHTRARASGALPPA